MYGTLNATQIETLLYAQVTAHLGCFDGERPYVVPISYLYDGTYLYGYTREGKKLRAMRRHPQVCVQVERIRGITDWQSVIAWGTYNELASPEEAMARQQFANRFLPLLGGLPIQHAHGMDRWGGVLYRIALTSKTGRYETP